MAPKFSLMKSVDSMRKGLLSSLGNKSQRDGVEMLYNYPPNSLIGLPVELLRKIVQNLSIKEWLILCLTCKYLNQFVYQLFLYQDVRIRDKDSLAKFKKSITKNKKTNTLSLYVTRIEFIQPTKDEAKIETTSIAGYQFTNDSVSTDPTNSYVALLLDIVSHLPNLTEISLREISPGFQFPEWASSLKTHAHEHNYYPSIKSLRLSSKIDWSIPLRPNLLWPFGLIDELVLYGIIIDSSSLTKPPLLTVANEFGPITSKKAVKSLSGITWSPIKSLSLNSCSIASNGSRYLEQYFKDVETLKLKSLKSHYDLLLAHCFPSLKNLYIDLNSKCFSLYDNNEAHSINVNNFNSNYAYHNSMFVPKFYLNYNNFVEVLEKLPIHAIQKISFINVSFTNLKPVNPEQSDDPELDLVNINLYKFLDLLKGYPLVEFIMLKNYKLHQPRTKQDWEELLQPVFSSTNSVRVKDKDGSLLFTRNERS